MHLSSAKALSVGTRNSDCYEVLTPKLKGIRAQERSDRSSGFQNGSKVIGYVLIERKLPPYFVHQPDKATTQHWWLPNM